MKIERKEKKDREKIEKKRKKIPLFATATLA
jgi:hypothetical protein